MPVYYGAWLSALHLGKAGLSCAMETEESLLMFLYSCSTSSELSELLSFDLLRLRGFVLNSLK